MIKQLLLGLVLIISSCKGVSQEKQMAMKDNEGQEKFEITKTDDQWRNQLDAMEYFVLREAGTERAFSSDLLKNKKKGVYVCAACGTELFKSDAKFDSGTGWPSFDKEIEGNVAFSVDYKIGYKRTEEHCATCGGHLGHVFEDGPSDTTGERHCINGVALNFVPK